MTPYIKAAANFVINCIPKFNLPRKYKISFSSGLDNEGHATFKDLGFVARPDHKFDVYAGGGFGLNGSRFGIPSTKASIRWIFPITSWAMAGTST